MLSDKELDGSTRLSATDEVAVANMDSLSKRLEMTEYDGALML